MTTNTKTRPVHTFQIPKALMGQGAVTLGLVQLTADEEMMAAKVGGQDGAKTAMQLLKMSLVEVDGKPVAVADGTADIAIGQFSPKVRSLALLAYSELHQPKEDEVAGFLKSAQVKVG